jgi:hypothetical protein
MEAPLIRSRLSAILARFDFRSGGVAAQRARLFASHSLQTNPLHFRAHVSHHPSRGRNLDRGRGRKPSGFSHPQRRAGLCSGNHGRPGPTADDAGITTPNQGYDEKLAAMSTPCVGAFMVAERRNRVVPHRGRFGLLRLEGISQFCIVVDVCGF